MADRQSVNTGDTFGRWTVIAAAQGYSHRFWNCRCVCGAVKDVRERKLLLAVSQVCRCASNASRPTHGGSQTPEYAVWRTLKSRILNPNNHKYHRYGGRGIKICERWLDFSNFVADMGRRPAKGYSIERKDNDGDYSPDNCYWATANQQARNRSDTRRITLNGVTRPFADWCEIYDIALNTAERRIYYLGWDVLEAFTMPLCANKADHQRRQEQAA